MVSSNEFAEGYVDGENPEGKSNQRLQVKIGTYPESEVMSLDLVRKVN